MSSLEYYMYACCTHPVLLRGQCMGYRCRLAVLGNFVTASDNSNPEGW